MVAETTSENNSSTEAVVTAEEKERTPKFVNSNNNEIALVFPGHLPTLLKEDISHPHVIFHHNNLDSVVRSICLPIPTGLQLNDGASYEGLDTADFKGAEFLKQGGDVSAQDALVLGIRTAQNFPGLDKIGDQLLSKARVASNPMTEMTFQGNSMRVLALNFSMTPRNRKEAESIRDIINTFRRLMYAEPTGDSGYTVKYPAMFRIEFLSGENPSEFFPVFYDCYLTALQTNYGAQTGGFIQVNENDSMYQQISINLEFAEGKMLTRRDLYGKGGSITPIPNDQAMKDENPDEAAITTSLGELNRIKRENNKTEEKPTERTVAPSPNQVYFEQTIFGIPIPKYDMYGNPLMEGEGYDGGMI